MSVSTRVRFARSRQWLATLRHYHEISGVGEMVRRYFALNAFDGALTTLGILAGGYIGGVRNGRTLVLVGATTALAMAVSGFYGSYLVEKAERRRSLRELEESTLTSLKDTDIGAASRYAIVVIATADGASPAVAAAIAFSPFVFTACDRHRDGVPAGRPPVPPRVLSSRRVPRPRLQGPAGSCRV